MADRHDDLDARLREARDISTPDLTPNPSIRGDIRSRLKARGSINRLAGRTGFLPFPAGSFGAIAAAAILTLFVLTGTRQIPTNSSVSGTPVASIDTSHTLDSLAMTADFLFHHTSSDSLSQ